MRRFLQERPVGDLVLSRNEFDPEGVFIAKTIEEVFYREALVWEIEVGGRIIKTTAEHPFWRKADGWTAVNLMRTVTGSAVKVVLGR